MILRERLQRRRDRFAVQAATEPERADARLWPSQPGYIFAEHGWGRMAGGLSALGMLPPGTYDPSLVGKVGVASRCLALCAQQIASMPLRFRRDPALDPEAEREPAWVAMPDPAWYPNGIRDALWAATWSFYARGDTFLLVTDRYENGYPRHWTVLDANTMEVQAEGGQRSYTSNGYPLDPFDVLQITRNPTGALRGTGAYAAYANDLAALSAMDLYAADVFASGGVPSTLLKPARRLTAEQAAELQQQWIDRVQIRLGAPAVIPPDVAFEQLAFSPSDLLLLDARSFEASELCGALSVPPPLLGLPLETKGLTYTTTADMYDNWWRAELYPGAARAVESALSTWVPRGSWVEFTPDAALKPNVVQAMGVGAQALAAGVMTVNEVRAWVFDLPPLVAPVENEDVEDIDEPAGESASMATAEPGPPPVAVPSLEVVST
jgi:hypothetical protein